MMSIKNHQISKLIKGKTPYDSYSDKPRSTKPFFIRAQDVCGRLDIDLNRIQKKKRLLAESTMDDATNNIVTEVC
jgi:hypothetical protein